MADNSDQPPRRNRQAFATRAIHQGYDPSRAENALNMPIHMTSTYVFDTLADSAAVIGGEQAGYIYGRGHNPTQEVLGDVYGHDSSQDWGPVGNPGRDYIGQKEPGDNGTSVPDRNGATQKFLGNGLRGHTSPDAYQGDDECLESENKHGKNEGREETGHNGPHDPFHRFTTLHVRGDGNRPQWGPSYSRSVIFFCFFDGLIPSRCYFFAFIFARRIN